MRVGSGKCLEMGCLVYRRCLILLGILILYGIRGRDCHDLSHSSILGQEGAEGMEEDLVECSMEEFHSVNRFWNCLLSEAGIDPQKEKEDSDPAKWGIRPVFPKVKVHSEGRASPSETAEKPSRGTVGGSSKRKGDLSSSLRRTKGSSRRRRESEPPIKEIKADNSDSIGAYKPLNSSIVFVMHPDPDFFNPKTGDPYTVPAPYLYVTNSKIHQLPPPWSYHGNMPPKLWHTLDLERFMLPINSALNLEQASFAKFFYDDLKLEFLFKVLKGTPRNIFSLWEEPLKNISSHQYYFDPNVKIHKGNTSVYVANNYLKGYYSFTRFPLPIKYLDNEMLGFIEKGLVRPPQELKPYMSLTEFTQFKDAMEVMQQSFIKDKNINYITNFQDLPDGPLKRLLSRAQQVLHPYDKGPPTTITTLFQQMIAEGGKLDMVLLKLNQPVVQIPNSAPFKMNENSVLEMRLRREYSLPVLPKRYPICSNWEPSPLDIVTKNAVNSSLRPYSSNDLMDQLLQAHVQFPIDGTNLLMVTLGEPSSAYWGNGIELSGGAVKGSKLYFDRMFIHVGQDKNSGSEHRLDGKSYGMELQFLFTFVGNSEYKPFQFVMSQLTQNNFPYREKLVVMLSVLVEVKQKDEMTAADRFRFEPLTQLISEYRKDRESVLGNHSYLHRTYSTEDYLIKLRDFLPLKGIFYTYRGSLTFPPCFEYIPWSIFEDTLQITEEQFLEFQLIPTEGRDDTGFLAGNSRQIEDIRVDDEIAPHVLPAEAEEMRKVREGRRVLRSLPVLTKGDSNEHYDYYFDYGNQAPCHPLGGPFLPSLAFLAAWMLQ